MPRLTRSLLATLLLAFVLPAAHGQSRGDPAVAVPNGTLMLAGGSAEIGLHETFVDLAGGADAEIVCVPTAGSTVHPKEAEAYCKERAARAGADSSNVTLLHTRDPEVANTDSFASPLQTADAVWFSGGRQWRLVDAYAGTKTLDGFWSVLERGGVIGGSSAGATIQGSYLVRGDTETNQIMMGDHEYGFGFLPRSAVDQHLLARGRQYDLIPVIETHPRLLGIGLDENTAIVVRGDTARVVGESVVAIYDHNRWVRADGDLDSHEKFFFLQPGDRFDLNTRRELSADATGDTLRR